MEINKIYNEDCLETMSRMPDGFVDLSLTSPPYNMNLRIRNGSYCSRQIIKEEFSTKYSEFSDNVPIEDFYSNHKAILSDLIRVSKITFYNISIVTGSKRAFFKMIGDFSENIKDIIIWDKCHAQPSMHHSVLNRQHEIILVLEKKENSISRAFEKCNFPRGELNDIWQIKRQKTTAKGHGAAFPEDLVNKILENFSNENDLIYDPFAGTGTVAKCCKNLNRKWISSEISDTYCKMLKKRLN